MIYGDGEQSRDFVYIDDVVEANRRAAAAQRGVGGKVFNIGSGQRLSVNQLLEKLERLTGHKIAPARTAAPGPAISSTCAPTSRPPPGCCNLHPSVGLDDGLARNLQWVKANAG